MIYTADYLVSPGQPSIPEGALRVVGNRITEVGVFKNMQVYPGESVYQLKDTVIMPGLINAHCHLELGMARGVLPHEESFTLWVNRLRKFLTYTTPKEYANATQLGVLECLKNGITTVVDVGNTGETFEILAQLPIRSYPHLELIGRDPSLALERMKQAQERLTQVSAAPLMRASLAAHAPFSCSSDLLQAIQKELRDQHIFFTMHLAESSEEQIFFLEGKGPLWDFSQRIYAVAKPYGMRPVQYLWENNLLPERALWVHGNCLDENEMRLLASKQGSLVHCPKSRSFFNHPRFNYEAARDSGLNICLGTDSLASNDGLNLFDEMAEFKRQYPSTPCAEILGLATVNAANALGHKDLGRLEPGALADFIALRFNHDADRKLEDEIVCEAHDVSLVVVNGEMIIK